MWIEELNENIEDDYCYSEAAAEIVDEYCKELLKDPGMSRMVVEEEETLGDEEPGEYWSDKACKLIETEIAHWREIGEKYFPDGDIDINMHLTQYREL